MQPRRMVAWLSALACAVALGCADDNPVKTLDSRLRLVHASSNTGNVDVYIDGLQVAQNVVYGTGSAYMNVRAGSKTIQVRNAGTATVVVETTQNLVGNTDNTLLIANMNSTVQAWLVPDDNSPPSDGNIRLRVVQAAPSAGGLDIYLTAPTGDLGAVMPNFTNIQFHNYTPYLEVASGQWRVRATPTGTKTVGTDTGSLTLSRRIRSRICASPALTCMRRRMSSSVELIDTGAQSSVSSSSVAA